MTSEKTHRSRARPETSAVPDPKPDDAPPSAAARPAEHWRSVLGGMSPREILARLLQGDPLELRRVVAARLAQRAYLFDADRVHLRALAHCARYAVRYRGTPPIEVWLAEIVDQALLDLLREDAQTERRGTSPEAAELAAFVDLARPLGLEPAAMRRACLAHNFLPEADRQAFHGLVISGRSLEQVARALGVSGVEVARRARRGLEAVLIAAGQLPRDAAHGAAPQEPEAEAGPPPAGAANPSEVDVDPATEGAGAQQELQP